MEPRRGDTCVAPYDHQGLREFFIESQRWFLQMILCLKCHSTTDVAYNELCYSCYTEVGRMPRDKKSRIISDSDQVEQH